MDLFFAKMDTQGLKLTYADLRFHTDLSNVMPSDVNLRTRFSRRIELLIPLASAAMDTVTESSMAIALASNGGIGVIHKNMTPEAQAAKVQRVKLHLNGLIPHPTTANASETLAHILSRREAEQLSFHSFPVLKEGKLVGLLTQNDFDFQPDRETLVEEAMTPLANLITAPKGTSIDEAYVITRREKRKILPLVDDDGGIAGLYVFADLQRGKSNESMHNIDSRGHLRVAAAVGVGEGALVRAVLLAEKGCDAFVIDTAHGDSANVHNTIRQLKELYSDIDIVAGNVSRATAAKRLAEAGADAVIVGQGGGSICTTRVVTGIGCPQASAVYDCVKTLRGTDIPVIADGGIVNPGDIVIALGLGAESVILGRLLAGAQEAPGDEVTVAGARMKEYRGMASEAALRENAGSRERYRQTKGSGRRLVAEGVEALIPHTGTRRRRWKNFSEEWRTD